jgi:hypothetical protein
MMNTKRAGVVAALVVGGWLGTTAMGATLSGSVTASSPASVDLTAQGLVDWAIWNYQAGSAGTNGAPSNRKSGGTAIGNVSAVLGTPRGITGTMSPPTYSYTDGTSPASGSGAIGAITDNQINVVGSGVKVSVAGDPNVLRTVILYVAGFNGNAELKATLNGAPVYTDSTVTYGSPRTGAVYTLMFQPDSAADLLQVQYTMKTLATGTGSGNANADIQAIAVAVPEPGVVSLIGVGAVGLLRRRRR